jgi:hypothetical protein
VPGRLESVQRENMEGKLIATAINDPIIIIPIIEKGNWPRVTQFNNKTLK